MLNILQSRLQQYMSHELQDVQAGFRKGRGTRDQISNIHWIIEKAREFQKTLLTVWITTICGKSFRRWEYQTTLPASWEICMQVEKEQGRNGTRNWFQIRKGVCQDHIYCHPTYLTYMQSTSCEVLGWMNHKLESRLPRELSIMLDMQMAPPLWQKSKRN